MKNIKLFNSVKKTALVIAITTKFQNILDAREWDKTVKRIDTLPSPADSAEALLHFGDYDLEQFWAAHARMVKNYKRFPWLAKAAEKRRVKAAAKYCWYCLEAFDTDNPQFKDTNLCGACAAFEGENNK